MFEDTRGAMEPTSLRTIGPRRTAAPTTIIPPTETPTLIPGKQEQNVSTHTNQAALALAPASVIATAYMTGKRPKGAHRHHGSRQAIGRHHGDKMPTKTKAICFALSMLLFSQTMAAAANRKHQGKWYQQKWCAERNGQTEVVLDDKTRVDCLTSNHAISC